MTSHPTSHRAPKTIPYPVHPSQSVERAVTAALVVAVIAGVGWIAGMIYTVLGWPL